MLIKDLWIQMYPVYFVSMSVLEASFVIAFLGTTFFPRPARDSFDISKIVHTYREEGGWSGAYEHTPYTENSTKQYIMTCVTVYRCVF
jgi:hypothetical protein